MNRLCAGQLRCCKDRRNRKVALCRWGRADADRLVGLFDMQRMPVGLRVDRHRGDPHAAQGAYDAARDRAAVCNQDLLKHHSSATSQIKTWTGVGLYALQGLLSWGQL